MTSDGGRGGTEVDDGGRLGSTLISVDGWVGVGVGAIEGGAAEGDGATDMVCEAKRNDGQLEDRLFEVMQRKTKREKGNIRI